MKATILSVIFCIVFLFFSTVNTQNTVAIRIVFLSSNTQDTLNVLLDNNTIFSEIQAGNTTTYKEFNIQNLNFRLVTSSNVEIPPPILMGLTKNFYSVLVISEPQNESSTVILDGLSNRQQDLDLAYIRFVHASLGVRTLSINSGGLSMFNNIAFGDISDYISLPQNSYNIQVTEVNSGNVMTTINNMAFDAGRIYTIYAYGPRDKFTILREFDQFELFNNTVTCSAKQPLYSMDAGIRVVNFISDMINMTMGVLLENSTLFPGLSFKSASGYVALPANRTYNFLAFPGLNLHNISGQTITAQLRGEMYSLVIFGYNGAFFPALFNDSKVQIAPTNMVNLRFGHALLFAPPVTLRVIGGPVIGSNINYGEVSCYNQLNEGYYDLELVYTLNIFGVSQEISLAKFRGISFTSGRVYTFYVYGNIGDLSINGDKILDYPNPLPCKGNTMAVC